MGIGAFFFGELSGFSEDFDEVAFELFDLLEVALDVSRNVLEVP